MQIFNCQLDEFEAINDLYYPITETPVCLKHNGVGLEFDVAGGGIDGTDPDCKVDIADIVAFAENWLGCGRYPETACSQ